MVEAADRTEPFRVARRRSRRPSPDRTGPWPPVSARCA